MIDRFSGEHRFLSNFYLSPVKMYGDWYPTVEHAFQGAKTLSSIARHDIRFAESPSLAKRLGKECDLRPDWENVKLDVMDALLRRKFFEDPSLRERLKATAPHELVEGNTWGDTYWGVCDGIGENHLGRLLMRIRDEA